MNRSSTGSVGSRLRRVRLQMMIIFLVAFVGGVGSLSVLAISLDSDTRDATTRTVATKGAEAVVIDENGKVDVPRFANDIKASALGSSIYLVDRMKPDPNGVTLADDDFYVISPEDAVKVQDFLVVEAGRAAVEAGHEVTRTVGSLRYFAVPYRADIRQGAVVAVAFDPVADDAHSDFTKRILVADALLITCALVAANVFGRRAMRASTVALEAQERFLANASHDLRTPIAAIRAAAESTRMQDVDASTAIGEVEKSAVVASDVIESMLTLARLDTGKQPELQPVRLDLLVEQLLDSYVAASRVTTDLDAVVVNGNPALLTRAITNLLNNAIEHSSADTAITLFVHDNWLAVRDRGPGIEPALLDSVFDRFATGGSSRGHGLGLSIVQAVAQAHGGSVEASNVPEGGCEFRIVFPRV
jgi:signal transduction histidine kinase